MTFIKPDWSKSHNGTFLCTPTRVVELMPEVQPILTAVYPHLQYGPDNYMVDVKVHMLTPGMYPCIPNYHCDFLPRDIDKKHTKEELKLDDWMYLFVSGEPKTEYKSYREKFTTANGDEWTSINQRDVHRGVASKIHTWRCFIRLIPKWFVHPGTKNIGELRRHSQVYLSDPDTFGW